MSLASVASAALIFVVGWSQPAAAVFATNAVLSEGIAFPAYPDDDQATISYPQATGAHSVTLSRTDRLSGAAGGDASYSVSISDQPGVMRLSANAAATAPDAPDAPPGFRFGDVAGNAEAGVTAYITYEDMRTFHIPGATSADRFTVQNAWNFNGTLNSTTGGTPGQGNAALQIIENSVGTTYSGAYPDGSVGTSIHQCCGGFPLKPHGPEFTRIEPLKSSLFMTQIFISDVAREINFTIVMATSAFGTKFDSETDGCPCDPGHASASAKFSDTISWGGIISVIDDATGLPVTDYTISSASGFDYSKPFTEPAAVPEPAAFVLFGTGLLGVAIMRRRGSGRDGGRT